VQAAGQRQHVSDCYLADSCAVDPSAVIHRRLSCRLTGMERLMWGWN
jgi:hypothetical protein